MSFYNLIPVNSRELESGCPDIAYTKNISRGIKNAHISVSICGNSRLSECQSIRSVR